MEEDAQEHRSTEIKIGPKAAAAGAEQGENKKNHKKALIQVISSTYAAVQPREPRYQLEVIPGTGAGCRGVVELTVELPGVLSVAQCQLSVSQVSGSFTWFSCTFLLTSLLVFTHRCRVSAETVQFTELMD